MQPGPHANHPNLVGRTVGKCRVIDRLGEGAMGIVYRAQHADYGDVCIKVVSPEFANRDDAMRRFYREAEAATRLTHENIVRGYGIEKGEGFVYLVQEYVPGGDLYAYAKAMGGRLPVAEALRVCREIAIGLSAAHASGLVHRDLKPGNVLLDEKRRAKIGDLGLVLQVDGDPLDGLTVLTQQGQVLGTPYYMAPEQWRESHDVDHKVDIYSLGVILHELLSGRHPITGKSLTAIMKWHLQKPPPPVRSLVPEVPEAVEKLILQCLAKEKADRPESASAIAAQIEEIGRGLGVVEAVRDGLHLERTMVDINEEGPSIAPKSRATMVDSMAPRGAPGPATGTPASAPATGAGQPPPPASPSSTGVGAPPATFSIDLGQLDGPATPAPTAPPPHSPPGSDPTRPPPGATPTPAPGRPASVAGPLGQPASVVGPSAGVVGQPASVVGPSAPSPSTPAPISSGPDAPTIKTAPGFVDAGGSGGSIPIQTGPDGEPLSRAGRPASMHPDDPILGSVVGGKFQVNSILGRGGMGVVYKAKHSLLGSEYALKVLLPKFAQDTEFRARFLQEAKAMQAFVHEGAVSLREFGEHEGSLYMALDFALGRTLGRALRDDGPFSEERIIALARQILPCLQKAHEAGLVHRDLKPGNVMLEKLKDGTERSKILDFGIAKVLKEAQEAMGEKDEEEGGLTGTGQAIGTPHYMSPEQASGDQVDARTDVYALACVFYELAMGRRPLEAATQQKLIYKILMDPPEPLSKVKPDTFTDEFDRAIMWGLAKDRNDRPASAMAFLKAIEGSKKAPPIEESAKPGHGRLPPTERADVRDLLPPPPPPPSGVLGKLVAAFLFMVILGAGGVLYAAREGMVELPFEIPALGIVKNTGGDGGNGGPVIVRKTPKFESIDPFVEEGGEPILVGGNPPITFPVTGKVDLEGPTPIVASQIGSDGADKGPIEKTTAEDGTFKREIGLDEGDTGVKLVAGWGPDHVSTVVIPVVVDVTAPELVVDVSETWLGGSIDVTATITDAHPKLVWFDLLVDGKSAYEKPLERGVGEGGAVKVSLEVPEGDKERLQVVVRTTDEVGLEANQTREVAISRVGPPVAITAPAKGLLTNAAAIAVAASVGTENLEGDVTVRLLDAEGAELWKKTVAPADGGAIAVDGMPLANEGELTIEVSAVDRVGNPGRATRTVRVDRTKPTIVVTQPSEKTTTVATIDVTVLAKVEDGSDIARVGFKAGELPEVALEKGDALWSTEWKLAEGENRAVVIAVDAAGNESTHDLTLTRDMTPPKLIEVLRDPPDDKVEATKLTITVQLDGPGEVTIGGKQAVPVSGDDETRLRAVVDLGPKRNEITIVIKDRWGNETPGVPKVVVTREDPFADAWWKPTDEQIAWAKENNIPLWFENDQKMRFVLIPPGEFQMGTNKDDDDYQSDEWQHGVKLTKAFYMSIHEVTNGQFRRFRADHDSESAEGGPTLNGDDQPVVRVSWEDADEFCAWLGAQAGDPELYRLPTEAEWEYACRAASPRPYPYSFRNEGSASRYANVLDAAAEKVLQLGRPTFALDDGFVGSAPVGKLRPNNLGVHDMHGNVFEWCQDWHGEYPDGTITDPKGPDTGSFRVARGGSFLSEPLEARSAFRNRKPPDGTYEDLGFRLVVTRPLN